MCEAAGWRTAVSALGQGPRSVGVFLTARQPSGPAVYRTRTFIRRAAVRMRHGRGALALLAWAPIEPLQCCQATGSPSSLAGQPWPPLLPRAGGRGQHLCRGWGEAVAPGLWVQCLSIGKCCEAPQLL